MVIKRINLSVKMLFTILILADICFFSIPIISDLFSTISSYHTKILCAVMIILMIIQGIDLKIKIDPARFKENILMLAYLLTIILTYVISAISYTDFSLEYYSYFIFCALYFVLNIYLRKYNGFYEFMIDTIIVIGIIFSIYAILTKYIYELNGNIIMSRNIQSYSVRNNYLRIHQIADFIGFSTMLSMIKFFEAGNWKKLRNIVGMMLGAFSVFVISQTRIYQIALIGTAVVLLIKSQKNNINKLAIIILMIIGAILMLENIKSFLETFVTYAESTNNRLLEYPYYLGHFFDYGILGLGFIPSNTNYLLLHGPRGKYSLTDCGYIGFISVFGIIGVIILIAFMTYILKGFKKAFFNDSGKSELMVCGLIVYIIISNWSVSIIDAQRCVIGGMMLSLLNYNLKVVRCNK